MNAHDAIAIGLVILIWLQWRLQKRIDHRFEELAELIYARTTLPDRAVKRAEAEWKAALESDGVRKGTPQ